MPREEWVTKVDGNEVVVALRLHGREIPMVRQTYVDRTGSPLKIKAAATKIEGANRKTRPHGEASHHEPAAHGPPPKVLTRAPTCAQRAVARRLTKPAACPAPFRTTAFGWVREMQSLPGCVRNPRPPSPREKVGPRASVLGTSRLRSFC